MIDSLLGDIRYTLRMWARNPGFTAAAVLTLALGIGANTTMFSVVNATLLRPLPFPEPDRLATLWRGVVNQPDRFNIVSMPAFKDWRDQSRTFESMAIFDSAGRGYNLTGEGVAEQVSGVRVTASFFDVLGVAPLLGRTFRPEEEMPGSDDVVVLSHALWTRRYAADGNIVGKTIQIDARPHTVVGVMPPTFRFLFGGGGVRQLWVPAGWTKGDYERGSNSFIAIGRLKADRSFEEARAEMETIGSALAAAHPNFSSGQTVRIVPMAEYGVARLRPTLVAMLGVVGFVLLIACVNVANLMLARALARTARARHPLRARRRTRGVCSGSCSRRACCSPVPAACAGCSSPIGAPAPSCPSCRAICATCRCGPSIRSASTRRCCCSPRRSPSSAEYCSVSRRRCRRSGRI